MTGRASGVTGRASADAGARKWWSAAAAGGGGGCCAAGPAWRLHSASRSSARAAGNDHARGWPPPASDSAAPSAARSGVMLRPACSHNASRLTWLPSVCAEQQRLLDRSTQRHNMFRPWHFHSAQSYMFHADKPEDGHSTLIIILTSPNNSTKALKSIWCSPCHTACFISIMTHQADTPHRSR